MAGRFIGVKAAGTWSL